MVNSIHYGFNQRFHVPAGKAYMWCTDFTPEDPVLMQDEDSEREVQRVAEDALILIDTYRGEGEIAVKQKLICLHLGRRMWTATHLTGPNKHSQFLYEIIPKTKTQCILRFTALYLDYSLRDEGEVKRLTRDLKKLDSNNWRLMAREMEKELKL